MQRLTTFTRARKLKRKSPKANFGSVASHLQSQKETSCHSGVNGGTVTVYAVSEGQEEGEVDGPRCPHLPGMDATF